MLVRFPFISEEFYANEGVFTPGHSITVGRLHLFLSNR